MKTLEANTVLKSCESTNDHARKLTEDGAVSGTWISAEQQSAGRGRRGNSWISEPGNLFLSMVIRDLDQDYWTWIPLATACALREALGVIYPELEIRIKWPNDLMLGQSKFGGILCEGFVSGTKTHFILGLGVNCNLVPDAAQVDGRMVTSLAKELSGPVNVDRVRKCVIDSLHRRFLNPDSAQIDRLISEYETCSYLKPGERVEWKDLSAAGGSGRVLKLGPKGELEVRLDSGTVQRLVSEEVQTLRVESNSKQGLRRS